MALSFGKGRGSGPVENTSVLPTFTAAPHQLSEVLVPSRRVGWGARGAGAGQASAQKTPLRGRSGPALMATFVGASAFASRAARVLKAPQLLQASIETPPPDAFAFLAMVFLAPEAFLAGAAFFFFGMAALQATAVRSCVHCHQLSSLLWELAFCPSCCWAHRKGGSPRRTTGGEMACREDPQATRDDSSALL